MAHWDMPIHFRPFLSMTIQLKSRIRFKKEQLSPEESPMYWQRSNPGIFLGGKVFTSLTRLLLNDSRFPVERPAVEKGSTDMRSQVDGLQRIPRQAGRSMHHNEYLIDWYRIVLLV
jgi:hypothetical protein